MVGKERRENARRSERGLALRPLRKPQASGSCTGPVGSSYVNNTRVDSEWI
jgi:hypothetical protein